MTSSQGKPDLRNPAVVCDLFTDAAARNEAFELRRGAVIDLPDQGHMLVTGDLHDHRVNFQKAVRYANLAKMPGNHLLLQELIHGERLINGMDLSYRTAAEVAALQLTYPGRVHVLLSNHELAQINGEDIAKHGISSIDAFHAGLEYVFDEAADDVHDAYAEWIRSLPLAVRCENGVFCAHSLPSPRKRSDFDPMVLTRELTDVDLMGPNGSAHLMVWGRNLAQGWADDLATLWNTGQFVLGHQHAEMGYELCGDTMLILASDHEHGVCLPINLATPYTRTELVDAILPFAALSAPE